MATADDFAYWKRADSGDVACEIDFIVTHVYAMWHGKQLTDALEFTAQEYGEVTALHPDHRVVLGEAGWATNAQSVGLQGKLIRGTAGEDQQRVFYRQFSDWSRENEVVTCYFEAFDENWKGDSHPDQVEKHWGLFRADRTPKAALREQASP